MPKEAGDWAKASRHTGGGGLHVYVGSEAVANALEAAGIPKDAAQLRVRSTWFKSPRKGRARILIELEEPERCMGCGQVDDHQGSCVE